MELVVDIGFRNNMDRNFVVDYIHNMDHKIDIGFHNNMDRNFVDYNSIADIDSHKDYNIQV